MHACRCLCVCPVPVPVPVSVYAPASLPLYIYSYIGLVQVIKEVEVEKRVEVPVIHYVDRETTVEKEVEKEVIREVHVPAPTSVQAPKTRIIKVPKVTYVEEIVLCEEGEEGQYLTEILSEAQMQQHLARSVISYTQQPHFTNITSYGPTYTNGTSNQINGATTYTSADITYSNANGSTTTYTNGATHTSNGTTCTQQPNSLSLLNASTVAQQEQLVEQVVKPVSLAVANGDSTVTPKKLFSAPLVDPFADDAALSTADATSRKQSPWYSA